MPHVHRVGLESIGFSLTIVLILTGCIYMRGWLRVRALRLHKIEVWRAVSFLVGLFLMWPPLASPLAAFDHELLTAHMLQHLLLMTLVPPLIWLGEPAVTFLHGLPRRLLRVAISPPLRWRVTQGMARAVENPAVCWLSAACTLVAWHVPAQFALGLQSEMWHVIERASFLGTGLLFWLPVVQPWPAILKWPQWSMLLYLFLATLPCDILSGFLVFCDRVVYPVYLSSARPFGLSALEDQQCAGALMWTCVTVIYLIAGTVLSARLLSPQNFREDRGVRPNWQVNVVSQEVGQTGEGL